MKTILKISSWLIILLVFTSCQKEIDVNLNSANPRIVIESEISDQPNSCIVKLIKTVNFNESNSFPAVSGALVKISDDLGNLETLTETSSGVYTSSTLQGVPGRTYTLEVTADEKTYTAISKMPAPTKIDTIVYENAFFGNQKFVGVIFFDSLGIENNYRLIQVVNGEAIPDISIVNDNLQDGKMVLRTFFSSGKDSLVTGDSVSVLLQSIDKNVYDYFRTLNQMNGGGQPSTPANPVSNLTNGALGYFSAYSVRSKLLVIP